MFELARRYIRTSLVFAAISVLLGMHMIAQRLLEKPQPLRWLPTAHGHIFLVGFVTMMIMGVAIWMFPRPKGRSLFLFALGSLLLAHHYRHGCQRYW
jgi:heme/copper-type cytochrome/quinol oxidase subunit 1